LPFTIADLSALSRSNRICPPTKREISQLGGNA
jgi:hypothetical protein